MKKLLVKKFFLNRTGKCIKCPEEKQGGVCTKVMSSQKYLIGINLKITENATKVRNLKVYNVVW